MKDKTEEFVISSRERLEFNLWYDSKTDNIKYDQWIGDFKKLKKDKNFNKDIILRQILDFYFKVNDELKNK